MPPAKGAKTPDRQACPLRTAEMAVQAWRHGLAVGAALVRQHLRPRALTVGVLRACCPCALLALLAWARRSFKNSKIKKEEALFPDLEEQFVDYLFCFTALCSIMMGLSFFVSRLAAERESGLRHLMHVSGLSRFGFWGSVAVIEGFVQGMFEAFLVALIAALFLEIRVVRESSPLLLLVALSLLVWSTTLLGCLLFMAFRSQRTSNIVGTVLAFGLAIAASVYSSSHPLVPMERVGVGIMICPVFTSYQMLWTLAKACSLDGGAHCLSFQDLNDGIIFSPIEMLFGSSHSYEATAGASFFSLIYVVLLQHALLWPVVLLADLVYHRPLKRDSGQAASDEEEDEEEADAEASSQLKTPRNANYALEIKHLVHWYGWLPFATRSDDDRVIDGVSFSIEPGAMLGLLGPNGAGKTTTIRCITGEETPRLGRVLLSPQGASIRGAAGAGPAGGYVGFDDEAAVQQAANGFEDGRMLLGSLNGSRKLGPASEAYLGLCPQESALAADLSVEDHLLFFARIRGAVDPERVAEHFLRAIRLEHRRDAVPDELSGGMRRRLAVGCCMVGHPALALLDEPTTGLDPVARREIWTSIMDARDRGTACLLTTHMLEEAEELATNIVVLARGKVAAEGSVQQLKDSWSTGYMLHVDSRVGEEQQVRQYIASLLPEQYKAPVKNTLHGQMIFNVSRDAEFVGHLFLQLARGAVQNGIRHWGISQASLEDAYMRIIGH